jgi:hypothetical protein
LPNANPSIEVNIGLKIARGKLWKLAARITLKPFTRQLNRFSCELRKLPRTPLSAKGMARRPYRVPVLSEALEARSGNF